MTHNEFLQNFRLMELDDFLSEMEEKNIKLRCRYPDWEDCFPPKYGISERIYFCSVGGVGYLVWSEAAVWHISKFDQKTGFFYLRRDGSMGFFAYHCIGNHDLEYVVTDFLAREWFLPE